MHIKVNRFEVETYGLCAVFIRIPRICQAFVGAGMTSFNWWSQVPKAERR
jgi:hypothetical protein